MNACNFLPLRLVKSKGKIGKFTAEDAEGEEYKGIGA